MQNSELEVDELAVILKEGQFYTRVEVPIGYDQIIKCSLVDTTIGDFQCFPLGSKLLIKIPESELSPDGKKVCTEASIVEDGIAYYPGQKSVTLIKLST